MGFNSGFKGLIKINSFIYILFNEAGSISHYMDLNFKMTGGDKLERVWIGAVTAQLKCCRVKFP